MKYFKNAQFEKRSYYCTNIVCCKAETKPNDGIDWRECDESEVEKMNLTQLYIQAGIRYFGYL